MVRNNAPMNDRKEFPFQVDIVDQNWITMDEGVRLSAKLWLPANRGPVVHRQAGRLSSLAALTSGPGGFG